MDVAQAVSLLRTQESCITSDESMLYSIAQLLEYSSRVCASFLAYPGPGCQGAAGGRRLTADREIIQLNSIRVHQ